MTRFVLDSPRFSLLLLLLFFFFPVVCIHRNATLFPLPTSLYLSGDNDQRFSTGICCIYGDLSCWIQLKIRVRAFFDVVISLRDKRFFFLLDKNRNGHVYFPTGGHDVIIVCWKRAVAVPRHQQLDTAADWGWGLTSTTRCVCRDARFARFVARTMEI